jgi:ribosomal protein L11 methyltransferase
LSYHYLEISLPTSSVDLVSALLLRFGATGLEERDGGTMIAAPPGQSLLVAWFDAKPDAEHAAQQLPGLVDDASIRFEVGEVDDPGWREAWREYFKPMRFGRRLWVVPPDEEPPADQLGDEPPAIVRLIPSGAFGTGTHESTAMMLEAIDELIRPGMKVLDVGCGSAILALAALRMGAESSWGIDIDDEALIYARENVEDNGLADRCRLDSTPLAQVEGRFDLVLANLSAPVLMAEKATLAARVSPGGILAWSGLLISDLTELGSPPGMVLDSERRRNEWAAQLWRPDHRR